MTLSRPMTLGEIRSAVQTRCGLGTTGSLPIDQQALVDEKIRSAQRMLFSQSWWTRHRLRVTITLTEDVADYDWPDTLSPEALDEVVVVRTSDSFEFELEPGIRPNERNSAARSSSAPLRYDYIDGILRIYPAPDDNWGTMILTGYGDVPAFTDDAELCVVDNEALIQYAEMLVKDHYAMPGVERLEGQLGRYLDDMRARQSPKTGVSLTGRQPGLLNPVPDNRISRSTSGSDWRDWHPWGE